MGLTDSASDDGAGSDNGLSIVVVSNSMYHILRGIS